MHGNALSSIQAGQFTLRPPCPLIGDLQQRMRRVAEIKLT